MTETDVVQAENDPDFPIPEQILRGLRFRGLFIIGFLLHLAFLRKAGFHDT